MAFSPSNDLLYIGFKSGLIRVYSLSYKSLAVCPARHSFCLTCCLQKNWSIDLYSELLAHRSTISSLLVCDEFHIVLSTSIDGKACLWDSNRWVIPGRRPK